MMTIKKNFAYSYFNPDMLNSTSVKDYKLIMRPTATFLLFFNRAKEALKVSNLVSVDYSNIVWIFAV